MIFKYYLWDKYTKNWKDTKFYFSTCLKENHTLKLNSFYQKLLNHDLATVPLGDLSMSLVTRSPICYNLYHHVYPKTLKFGMISQVSTPKVIVKSSKTIFDDISFIRDIVPTPIQDYRPF